MKNLTNVKDFHNKRKAFYFLNEQEIIVIPEDMDHFEFFTKMNMPEMIETNIRGYFLDDHVLVYIGNDFRIPDITILALQTIKEFFKTIKWIGIGCKVSDVGNVWEPIMKIKLY